MKEKSLSLILKTRFRYSVIYYVCMLFYGMLVICLYGIEDIGIIYGLLIFFSFHIAIICILAKSESLLRYADPLNIYNRKKYTFIIFIESSAIIIAYILANASNKNYFHIIAYCIYVTIIFFMTKSVHQKIINEYSQIKIELRFDGILACYRNAVKDLLEVDTNTSQMFNNFVKFIIYTILFSSFYEFTLYNWIFTCILTVFNLYILWKLHWIGIKKLVRYNYFYFGIVCASFTGGVIFLKLIYDKIIYISIFNGRDVQEYYMVLILFLLPLLYYGSKVAVRYINDNCKWVE